ncbi:unnamed protein product, partial [Mesorhabditis belari]|uniref:Uncharacterized protein n=1 Tax=Mesorhabditis belari TaxID=2138241 RepID=A0AAF3J9F9_9BILA
MKFPLHVSLLFNSSHDADQYTSRDPHYSKAASRIGLSSSTSLKGLKMIDPVYGGVFGVIVIAALVFCYFARQDDSDEQYDRFAKNLVVEKKLPGSKVKPQKNKKEKKTVEKKERPRPSSPKIIKLKPQPHVIEKPQIVSDGTTDRECQMIPQDPVSIDQKQEVVQQLPTPATPVVVEEVATAKDPEVIIEACAPIERPVNVVEETQSQREANIAPVQVLPQAIEKSSRRPMSKRKKKAVPSWDLNDPNQGVQELLGYLGNVDAVEPECISLLAQYFADLNDKATNFKLTISNLEKSLSDLRQRAEQHCVARMSAEKDSQTHQHHVAEMGKKMANLEKELENNKANMDQLKKAAAENNSLTTTNVELKTEMERLQQMEQSAQQQSQVLQQQVKEWKLKSDAALKEIQCLRLSLDHNRQAQADLNEIHAELIGRDATISLIRSEFAELELLTRDYIQNRQQRDKMVYVASLKKLENTMSGVTDQWNQLSLELETKEDDWKSKEITLRNENDRLLRMVDDLKKEKEKLEHLERSNATIREQHLEKEATLKKLSAVHEATQECLKSENESLKASVAAVRCEMSVLISLQNQELSGLRATCAQREEENVKLKKTNDKLTALSLTPQQPAKSATTIDQMEHLCEENQRLLEKIEELRSRNHAIMSYVYDLEAKMKTQHSAAPQDTTKHPKPLKVLVDCTVAKNSSVVATQVPAEAADLEETFKNLATNLEKIESTWESRMDKCETIITQFEKKIAQKNTLIDVD